MVLSKINNKSPSDLASILAEKIKKEDKFIEEISVVKPGFINIKFKPIFWTNFIKEVIKNSKSFGTNKNIKRNYLIEFVSANPTGPLHVGHGRGAVFGSVLSRLLKEAGFQVDEEYYVNDFGRQMNILSVSLWIRYAQIFDKNIKMLNNGYQGDYLIVIAQHLKNEQVLGPRETDAPD